MAWRAGLLVLGLAASLGASVAFAQPSPEAPAEAGSGEAPLDGFDAGAYRARGDHYRQSGDNERALRDYDEALKRDPDDVDAMRARGGTLFALGRYRDAVGDFTRVLDRLKDDGQSRAWRAVALGVLQEQPGAGFRNKAEFETALGDYAEAIRLLPDEQAALRFGRGELLANRGETARALEDFEAAAKLDPAVSYLVRLAAARLESGDRAGAREALERAVAAPWSEEGSARARRDLMALRGPDEPPLELPSAKGLKVAEAEVGVNDQGLPVVRARLDEEGRARFAEFTAQNVGRRVDLLLGEEVLASPVIREPITGGAFEIMPQSDEAAARKLRDRLANGETLELRAAE